MNIECARDSCSVFGTREELLALADVIKAQVTIKEGSLNINYYDHKNHNGLRFHVQENKTGE